MEIRKLNNNDLVDVLSLYKHLRESDTDTDFETAKDLWLQTEKCEIISYWGLFIREVLVSSCQVALIPNLARGGKPYGLIENVVTASDYRNKGFGKSLLNRVLD